MLKNLILAIGVVVTLAATSVSAQEFNCEKPVYPPCAFAADVWLDQQALQDCGERLKEVGEQQKTYQECLWTYRDDAIFRVDGHLAEVVAELAAMQAFSRCRIAAGPSATKAEIERCPIPVFVQK